MLDLIVIVVSTWTVFGMVLADVSAPVRTILGFFMVFFVPGYAFLSMIFVKREIGTLAKFGLSIGFSIVLISIISYMLTYTQFEVKETPTFLTLSIATTCFCLISFFLRYRAAKTTFANFIRSARYELNSLNIRIFSRPLTVGLSLAAALAVSILIFSLQGVESQPFTGFSVLSASGNTHDYANRLKVGEQVQYQVSIENREIEPTEYRLQLLPPDQNPTEIISFALDPGNTKEVMVEYVPRATHELGKLQFLLYRNSESTPYKTAYILVTITEG